MEAQSLLTRQQIEELRKNPCVQSVSLDSVYTSIQT
jgi:hypothetical protein